MKYLWGQFWLILQGFRVTDTQNWHKFGGKAQQKINLNFATDNFSKVTLYSVTIAIKLPQETNNVALAESKESAFQL